MLRGLYSSSSLRKPSIVASATHVLPLPYIPCAQTPSLSRAIFLKQPPSHSSSCNSKGRNRSKANLVHRTFASVVQAFEKQSVCRGEDLLLNDMASATRSGDELECNETNRVVVLMSKFNSRRFTASSTLVPLEPLPLARTRLKVRCNDCRIATAGNHSAAHLVAVSVKRALQEERATCVTLVLYSSEVTTIHHTIECSCLSPAHAIAKLVQGNLLVPLRLGHAWYG